MNASTKLHPYYNYDELYGHNGVFNFLVGGRGIGKTYGAKLKAIRASIKRGDQFIYLRRYKPEMSTARNTFFNDIIHEFPDYDFRVHGNIAEWSPAQQDEKKRTWKVLCYFITLSTAQSQKSVAFPNVKLIIFDEFIIEKGAVYYLPDETTIFTNFFSTVDRYKDKTKVLFLANSVSIMNPYFIQYDIMPTAETEWLTKEDGFIVCHFPNSAAFEASIYNTRFGKFIKGTEYAAYAAGNMFADNGDNMLKLKGSNSRYLYSLECHEGTFSIWYDSDDGEYFIQAKRPKSEKMFTLIAQRMDSDKPLLTFNDRLLGMLRTAFRRARISFDKPATRNAFIEVFKR